MPGWRIPLLIMTLRDMIGLNTSKRGPRASERSENVEMPHVNAARKIRNNYDKMTLCLRDYIIT